MGDLPGPKAIVSWSSGKDSAWALHEVRTRGDFDVVAILTTVTAQYARVSMHGVREVLLDQQADALGLPVVKVGIPSPCPNEVYEREMARALEAARADDVQHVVFGDLFLQDIRDYREAQLARLGMTGVFPIWHRDTTELAREMVAVGVVAVVTCVDPSKLDRSFAGRTFDERFIDELPAGVDPCGENGEFHTFVTRGPMFSRLIDVRVGEVVERECFVFADVVPAES